MIGVQFCDVSCVSGCEVSGKSPIENASVAMEKYRKHMFSGFGNASLPNSNSDECECDSGIL